MKNFIAGFLAGAIIGGTLISVAAGITKIEMSSKDAISYVGYGTSDAGDTIVRIKTDANGVLQIKGV